MTFSVDFLADDWRHIKSKEITRRAIERIEARGRGILLLHDIQPATALALPDILKELKARGYKIVHMVPATADRPKTATELEQWVARRTPEQQLWGAHVPVVGAEGPEEPMLPVPSPESFGIEHFGEPAVTIALADAGATPYASRRKAFGSAELAGTDSLCGAAGCDDASGTRRGQLRLFPAIPPRQAG